MPHVEVRGLKAERVQIGIVRPALASLGLSCHQECMAMPLPAILFPHPEQIDVVPIPVGGSDHSPCDRTIGRRQEATQAAVVVLPACCSLRLRIPRPMVVTDASSGSSTQVMHKPSCMIALRPPPWPARPTGRGRDSGAAHHRRRKRSGQLPRWRRWAGARTHGETWGCVRRRLPEQHQPDADCAGWSASRLCRISRISAFSGMSDIE